MASVCSLLPLVFITFSLWSWGFAPFWRRRVRHLQMFSFEDKGGTTLGVSFAQVTVTPIQVIILGKHTEGANTFSASTFFLFCSNYPSILTLSGIPYHVPKKVDFRVVNFVLPWQFVCSCSLNKGEWSWDHVRTQTILNFRFALILIQDTALPILLNLLAVKNPFSLCNFFLFLWKKDKKYWLGLGSPFFKYLKASNELSIRKTMGTSLSQSCGILAHSPLLVNNCIGFLNYKGCSQRIRLDPEKPKLKFCLWLTV